MTTARSLVLASLLVLVLVPASVTAGTAVGEEAFSGRFRAYTGLDRAGPAYLGAYVGGLASPEGAFSVPRDADAARIAVDWTPQSRAAERFIFRVCEGSCDRPGSRVLAEANTTGPAELAVPIPDSGNLTWEALVARGAAVNATVEGTARYMAAERGPTGDQAATPATPSATGTGGSEVWLWSTVAGTIAALVALAWNRLRVLLVALYHRIDGDDRLDHPTRQRIRALVEDEPGLHFNAIRTRLDLSRGQLEHHLRLLLDADLLAETSAPGYRCFFLPGELAPVLEDAATELRSRTARRLLAAIGRAEASSLSELAERLGVAVSTAAHHVDQLEAADLVRRERSGPSVRVEPTDLGVRAIEALL